MNKFNYLYVLQGDYGHGYEDLIAVCKTEPSPWKKIRTYKRDYEENDVHARRLRIIERREKNTDGRGAM